MLTLFAKWITKRPKLILAVATLLLLPAFYGADTTRINYDVLSYLPRDKESVQGQDILESTFHNAATSMIIFDNMPEKDVLKLQDQIKELHGVNDVISIRDGIGVGVPKEFLPKELREAFFSAHGTILMVKYEEAAASEQTMENIAQIRSMTGKQCFITGLSVFLADLKNLVLSEMPKYMVLAGLLSWIVLTLCIESWVLPIIFLVGIFYGIAYNFGTNLWLGQISYITQAIASILQLAVTTDYSIFVIHRYDEEKQKHADNKDAMASAVVSAFTSLAGSSLTTIAGFGSLCFMNFTLGRDIGVVMMKGVVFGVLTCVTILPALILLFDGPIHKYTHRTLIPEFHRLTDFIMRHRKTAILIFLIAFLPALFFQSQTKIYYNIDESLPKDLPSNVANAKLKKDFNMATSHFIIVREDIPAYRMKDMLRQIERVDGVKNVMGYDKMIGPSIPESFIPNKLKDAFRKDGLQMVMVNSYYKPATDQVNAQLDSIQQIIKSYDPEGLITGEAPLTKDLADTVNVDIKVTNLLSILAIFIIVAIAFRSISVPVILVGCIELAIFINMGLPYVFGHSIPFVSPIVIGAIQLGATVDYSILMSTRFQEELKLGKDKAEAIRITTKESAKSIITSALVFFAATTGVVFLTSMDIIKSICEMLARGAIISAVVILFILPPLLYVAEGIINKTSYNWK